jgi:hypothetical protein
MQSLLLAAQILGCWAGPANVELMYQEPESCSEMRLELRVEGNQLSLVNRGMDCDRNFNVAWEQKSFEVRNQEVWGGRHPGIIGWLKPQELVIAEAISALTWTEWKGVVQADLLSEQHTLHWEEVVTKGDSHFWRVRSELLPVDCREWN